MRRPAAASAGLLSCSWLATALAQSPGMTDGLVLNPIAPTSGRGVSHVALINHGGVRFLRLDIEPAAVRTVHAHDVWPSTGSFRSRDRCGWTLNRSSVSCVNGRRNSSRGGRPLGSRTPARRVRP